MASVFPEAAGTSVIGNDAMICWSDRGGHADRAHGLRFSPESEVSYTGDETMLRRVVMNLLDNAIKYTPAEGTVTAHAEPQAGGGAVIRVSDSGVGIAPEHQPRIFERFYRVQHTMPRTGLPDATGAGLGLPIAAWIAKAHGGSLVLAQSDERGSVFELRLPPYRLQLG